MDAGGSAGPVTAQAQGQSGMGGSMASESEETSTPPLRGESRGRKNDMNLPPSRAREVQRAFRARRAAHLAKLEDRVLELEAENAALRLQLALPPAPPDRVIELGSGPTGKGKSLKAGGVPMSERVKAKKERDRKKGITRSPDREDLDTRTKLEKLKQIESAATGSGLAGSLSPSALRERTASASVARSERSESAEHASPNGVGAQAFGTPYGGLFGTMPMLGGARPSGMPDVNSNGMPFNLSDFGSPAAGSSTNRQDLPGNSGAPTPNPFNFGFPFNPFSAYGLGESPAASHGGGTPHTDAPAAPPAPAMPNGAPADSSFTQLMFLLAHNPEFQAKMAQAQQAAAAAAIQGVLGANPAVAANPAAAFGGGAAPQLNLPFGMPGMGMPNGGGAALGQNGLPGMGGIPPFQPWLNAPVNSASWPADANSQNPFSMGNGEQAGQVASNDSRQAILSPAYPDGQAPLDPGGAIALGLSRAPDEVSGRLRPPSFSSDGGSGGAAANGEFAFASGPSTRPDSGMGRPVTGGDQVNVNGKRPASAMQAAAFAKPGKRDSLSSNIPSASGPAGLSQASLSSLGGSNGDEVSLLDRLKNCCRISEARSTDSALMLFASRLCLAVPCNYAGLHDHDGQTAPGYRTVEEAYTEMWAVLQHQSEANGEDGQSQHPSVQLAVGRLAGERLLKAVKEEMAAAVALSRETGDEHVHGRRVSDWIGCRPATGFGISESLIRKVVAEEQQQQQQQ